MVQSGPEGSVQSQAGESVSKLKPVDRSSFEPPYAQVARSVRERIARGEYRGRRPPALRGRTLRAVRGQPHDGAPGGGAAGPRRRRHDGERARDVREGSGARRRDLRPRQPAPPRRRRGHDGEDQRGADRAVLTASERQARARSRLPGGHHQAHRQQRRGAGLLPQRVPRLRSTASARRGRVRRHRAARPARERGQVGIQVRPSRPARLHALRDRGLLPPRRAGRAGVGGRAPLLRLRGPPRELGPVHRPGRPPQILDHGRPPRRRRRGHANEPDARRRPLVGLIVGMDQRGSLAAVRRAAGRRRRPWQADGGVPRGDGTGRQDVRARGVLRHRAHHGRGDLPPGRGHAASL